MWPGPVGQYTRLGQLERRGRLEQLERRERRVQRGRLERPRRGMDADAVHDPCLGTEAGHWDAPGSAAGLTPPGP